MILYLYNIVKEDKDMIEKNELNRAEEAWDDIIKIAAIWKTMDSSSSISEIASCCDRIDEILKENGWI